MRVVLDTNVLVSPGQNKNPRPEWPRSLSSGAAVCSNRPQETLSRHCEERSDDAISIG
jgi:hypothetical protein